VRKAIGDVIRLGDCTTGGAGVGFRAKSEARRYSVSCREIRRNAGTETVLRERPFDDASQKRIAGALRFDRTQWTLLAPGIVWRIIYLNSWCGVKDAGSSSSALRTSSGSRVGLEHEPSKSE
jgi:hypothetical protein